MTWLLTIAPVAALIAMAMSFTHLLPIGVSLTLNDGTAPVWILSMALNFASGAILWLTTRRHKRELNLREGILLLQKLLDLEVHRTGNLVLEEPLGGGEELLLAEAAGVPAFGARRGGSLGHGGGCVLDVGLGGELRIPASYLLLLGLEQRLEGL